MSKIRSMKTKFNYKELSKNSQKYHANSGYMAYILFFFGSLFSAGLLLINLLFPFLFIIIVPLFVIPIIFACQVALDVLKTERFLTFRDFLKCFTIYFSEHFRSTFRVLRSFAISLVAFGSVLLTSIFAVSLSFYYTDFMGSVAFVNDIINSDLSDIEVIESIINDYRLYIDTVLICTELPALVASSLTFSYLVSRNSFNLIYRLKDFKYSGKYFASISDSMIKNNKKLYLQCYWSLNWPMILLFLLGLSIGGYIGYLYSYSYNAIFTFGFSIAVFVSFAIYGAKYYANKQAIAEYLLPEYKVEEFNFNSQFKDVLKDLINKMQNNAEDTKKDSDES